MKNPSVDWYFTKHEQWQKELEKLRDIVLDCLLTEELKWGVPCYTFQKSNVLLLHVFKEYCAVLFHKGALLNDSHHLLIQQTENVQSARQMRFSNVQEIIEKESILKSYIYEAIEIEKVGLKVELKPTSDYTIPEEFQRKLANVSGLRAAFDALTPGRQRGYLLYFSAPKQAKTRESRIENYMKQILDGKGLND